MSYLALGPYASELVAAQRLDWPLGPLEQLPEIHLAEQRLDRSRFYRSAKVAEQLRMEFPNIPGQSHRFDEIEPHLRATTREVMIGTCRARRVPIREVLAVTERLILANPAALLCDDPDCRCGAALEQRLDVLSRDAPA